MTRRLVAAVGLATLAVSACGSGSSGGDVGTVAPASGGASPTANANGCNTPPGGQPRHEQFSHEPALTIARTTYTATITTNCGTIKVSLDGKHAPHTVNSFAFLAAHHYFDNTKCHRLTTSGIFVLQCGDPTATGRGGPGYQFRDENLSGATYGAGTVAMANAGPGTNGSQFFFVYANTQLPPAYTPFGHITAGLDVLQKIAKQGSTPPGDGTPNQTVVIETFTVTRAG